MAKAFYNSFTNSTDAEAAGTVVKEVGQNLLERKKASSSKNFFVLDVMKEEGIDMSQATRQQLTTDKVARADLVVSMEDKEHTPDWLLKSPKYVFWDIPDPRGQEIERTREIRDEIRAHVHSLLK